MITERLVIFDYDGVIADSLALWVKAFEIAGEKNNIGYRLDRKTIDSLEHITFSAILRQAGLENSDIAGMYVSDILEVFRNGSSEVPFFEGIGSLIRKISEAGNIVCINTANNSGIVGSKLDEEGILQFVSSIAGGDTEGSKSEKIRTFMKKYSFEQEKTFMIGDSLGDITEGKKAGVMTIAAGYGWHGTDILMSGCPDYFCISVGEMDRVFSNMG